MSLIYCPECGHEVSASAVACPNCGRPINGRPVIERKVVAATHHTDGGFPPWAVAAAVIAGAGLLLLLFLALRGSDDAANSNLAVNVSARRSAGSLDSDEAKNRTSTATTSIPPSSVQTVTGSAGMVTSPPAASSENIPATTVAEPARTNGTVIIDAKVAAKSGAPRPVRNERFYLLDKDFESILSEAGLEPIDGQSMTNSLGLSVLFPDRYAEFNRSALQAIKDHIKYAGQTDASGKAQLGNVEPNSYYLFGITKTGSGFAVWSAPVTVIAGQNNLALTPAPVTELTDSSG